MSATTNTTDEIEKFEAGVRDNIQQIGKSAELKAAGLDLVVETSPLKSTYDFKGTGLPIIQFPQDMIAMQEIRWDVQPDRAIETGIGDNPKTAVHEKLLIMMAPDGYLKRVK